MSDTAQKVKCPTCGLAGNPGEFCMNGCGRLPAADGGPGAAPSAMPSAAPVRADASDREDRILSAMSRLAAAAAASHPASPAPQARAATLPSPAEARGNAWAKMWDAPAPAATPQPYTIPPSAFRPRPAGSRARAASPVRERVEVPKDFSYGNPFGTSVSAAERGECPVELEGVVPDAFVVGTNLSMRFRVFGRGGSYPEIVLKLCKDDDILAESPRKPVRSDSWTNFSINYCPREDGRISVRLVLTFEGSDGETYESDDFDVTVYPKNLEDAQSVAVTINNEYRDINVDRAGEARFGNTTADIAKAIEAARPGEKVAQILDRCSRNQEFRRYPLRAARLPSRLTLLDSDGFELHVFSDESLSFGRSRQGNDVVLRVFGSDRQVDNNLSCAISKTHFRIARHGIQYIKIRDGGLERDNKNHVIRGSRNIPSTLGTLIDGKAIEKGGTANLGAGDCCEIGVAPVNGAPVLILDASVGRCPEGHRSVCGCSCPPAAPASLLIRRRDGVQEAYLAVWQCAHLGEVFPELDGYYLHWDGACFKVETPHCETVTLRHGCTIGPSNCTIYVAKFEQSHI